MGMANAIAAKPVKTLCKIKLEIFKRGLKCFNHLVIQIDW